MKTDGHPPILLVGYDTLFLYLTTYVSGVNSPLLSDNLVRLGFFSFHYFFVCHVPRAIHRVKRGHSLWSRYDRHFVGITRLHNAVC